MRAGSSGWAGEGGGVRSLAGVFSHSKELPLGNRSLLYPIKAGEHSLLLLPFASLNGTLLKKSTCPLIPIRAQYVRTFLYNTLITCQVANARLRIPHFKSQTECNRAYARGPVNRNMHCALLKGITYGVPGNIMILG